MLVHATGFQWRKSSVEGLIFHNGIIHRGIVGKAKQETVLYFYKVLFKAEDDP